MQPFPQPLPRDTLVGWKIVVIDDEMDSSDVASRILRFYGAEVWTAINGQAGLDLIRTVRPRLIICDLSMPGLDGYGMIQCLKDERDLATIPAIALTAHVMTGDREKAIAAGFHNYLSKPLSPLTFVRDLLALLVDLPQFPELIAKLNGKSADLQAPQRL